jgi:uncharacterized protein (DUF1778 family)
MENKKRVQLCINIHPDLRKTIKRRALIEEKTMQEWVIDSIVSIIELQEKGII